MEPSNELMNPVSRSLISFSEALSQISTLEDWMLFIASKIPKRLEAGELILFFESEQFGLRRMYVKNSIFYEEMAQTHWPTTSQIEFSNKDINEYLTQEMGRPFLKCLCLPFINIQNENNKKTPMLFIETKKSGSEEFQNFFKEREEILTLTLNRILLSNYIHSSSFLWKKIFGEWNEPLTIVKNIKSLTSNKAFIKILNNHPNILNNDLKNKQKLDLDGITYCVHYHPIPTEKKSEEIGIFYFENMKEQFDLQEQFFRSQKMSALHDLGKNIAHELNNPLTGIRSISQILSNNESLQDFQEDLKELEKASARCQNIIEKLLTFSQFKKQESFVCSLDEVIEDTLSLLHLITSGIEIKKEISNQKVVGDFSVLQQVLYNLIVNASQALKSYEKQKDPMIEIFVEDDDTHVFLKVRDNGPGIAKEHLEKIFQPLWTTKKDGEGTGLGLGIARYMLQHWDAGIQVQSQVDEFTCFTISIPKKDTTENTEATS